MVSGNRGSGDVGRLLLRLAVGGLLLFHGISKLRHGVGWMAGPLGRFGLPSFFAYGAFLGEILGPLMVLSGWRTRLGALLVAADLLMAIVLVVHGRVLTLNGGGGWGIELEAFFVLGALALFFLGGGRYGVTRGRGRWD